MTSEREKDTVEVQSVAGHALTDSSLTLRLPHGRQLIISSRPAVMGILNITPDSFSDGGVHFRPDAAIESALRMEEDGASIIDVGGESTRPGAQSVSEDEERARVIPVIEGIRKRSDIPISIDTMKSGVAASALDAGADLVNDVTALRHDESLGDLIAQRGVPVILMHMRGEPRTMQAGIFYEDLIGEIRAELSLWVEKAIEIGIDRTSILIDPGIGFGKTFEHNLEILRRSAEIGTLAPMVIGASRKAFVGHLTGRASGADRTAGSLAAVAAATLARAAIVRVHDVRETVDFLRVFKPILQDMR